MFKKKTPEGPTPTEKVLEALTAALKSQSAPNGTDFAACLARSSLALLNHYEQEDSALSFELEKLVAAFFDRKDPFIASLGFIELAPVRALLNIIRMRRKQRRADQEAKKAGT